MRLLAKIKGSLALLLLGAMLGRAEEVAWQPVRPPSGSAVQTSPPSASLALAPVLGEPEKVVLGEPEKVQPDEGNSPSSSGAGPIRPASATRTDGPNRSEVADRTEPQQPADENPSMFPFQNEIALTNDVVVRGQIPDPVPTPFGGPPVGGPAPVYGPPPNPVSCGVPEKDNHWQRFCDNVKDCCKNVFGSAGNMFQPSPNHKPFQSDHDFDMFSSPVTNPFFLLDPRSLTEVKPMFIYQHTPSSNPIFAGGSNYFLGLQGSLALTEYISFKISEIGLSFMEPNNPSNNPLFGSNVGVSELHLGPQFTLIRNKDTKTLLAAGMTFEIPWGSEKTFQHTGTLGVVPYVSFGQNFLYNETWGSFNFLNTTGWSFGSDRSDFFFSSFHLDYNIKNLNRFFPMIELNWAHYTNSGNQTPVNFEGWDLYNFGANGVAGTNAVTLNLGGRVQINDFWSVGLAGGWSLVGGGNQLDNFRLTVDMIFRY